MRCLLTAGQVGGETEQAQDMQLAENLWKLCTQLAKEKAGADALYDWNES